MCDWYVGPDGVARKSLSATAESLATTGNSRLANSCEQISTAGSKPVAYVAGVAAILSLFIAFIGIGDSDMKLKRTSLGWTLDEQAMQLAQTRKQLPQLWASYRRQLLDLEENPSDFPWFSFGWIDQSVQLSTSALRLRMADGDDRQLADALRDLSNTVSELTTRQVRCHAEELKTLLLAARSCTPLPHGTRTEVLYDPSRSSPVASVESELRGGVNKIRQLRQEIDRLMKVYYRVQ